MANRGYDPAKTGTPKEINVPMQNQSVPRTPTPVEQSPARVAGRGHEAPKARP